VLLTVKERCLDKNDFQRDFDRLFDPRSIAFVGASNLPGKWGYVMPLSVIGGGYTGKLAMINPRESSVMGFPTYRSLLDVKHPVDLIVVTIPASGVLGVMRDAAAIGARNAVVVSSDFSEVGEEGAALERELAAFANEASITIMGPNTMGMYSSSSSLTALGAPVTPTPGQVGFVSQSGNLGVQLLAWGKRRGIGFSRFVGCGNAANTDITDYLEYLGKDPLTGVIALYLEGLKEGRRFLETARGISRNKPIVVLKGGRGAQGSKAAQSHSGAMAGELKLFEGMFEQAGVVEAESSEEFIDLVAAFDAVPRARGKRIAIMTMGGGWGVVAADSCDREGLELAELPATVIEELDGLLPRFWSRGNPVDLVGNLNRSNLFRTAEVLAACDEVDILVVMGALLSRQFFLKSLPLSVLRPFYNMIRYNIGKLPMYLITQYKGLGKAFMKTPGRSGSGSTGASGSSGSSGINPREVLKWTDAALISRMAAMVREYSKPIITVAMDQKEMSGAAKLQEHGIFVAHTPERAIKAAGKLARHGIFANRST
jgi:acyl-CoA synthetase (NDP forming)